MQSLVFAIFLAALWLAGCAEAQQLPVTTTAPGFTPPQCVQSLTATVVQDAGACPGRRNLILVDTSLTLTNVNCGSVLEVPGDLPGPYEVTLPPAPPYNCEFTFEPATADIYVNFNDQYALLPGWPGQVTQWTIPSVSTFRTNNPSVSLQFNGTNWEQSGFSSPIFLTAIQPADAAQLAHGQVHFGWNSSSSQFNLCPSNGPGGLIVDSVMIQVPGSCLALAQWATTPSALNYFGSSGDRVGDFGGS